MEGHPRAALLFSYLEWVRCCHHNISVSPVCVMNTTNIMILIYHHNVAFYTIIMCQCCGSGDVHMVMVIWTPPLLLPSPRPPPLCLHSLAVPLHVYLSTSRATCLPIHSPPA